MGMLLNLLLLLAAPAYISCFAYRTSTRVRRIQCAGTRLGVVSLQEQYDLPVIDVRMFLTQRSIQSFLFLLASVNDVHTIKWMDDFTQPIVKTQVEEAGQEEEGASAENNASPRRINVGWVNSDKKLTSKLLRYHGTDAMNTELFPTWHSYFRELANQPSTTLTISTPINPLVPNREFEIDIQPPRLCARLLSVREQIASEWAAKDLDVIGNAGLDMFYSYWETVKNGNNGKEGKRQELFEHGSKLFMDASGDTVTASPLRIDNFDLLYNLATQESIHRVLEQGISVDQDEDGTASTTFLLDFYLERLDTHFLGDLVRSGKGDDFIEELMHCTPRVISATANSEAVIVNPVTIAEVVLKMREKVATEWKEVAVNISSEHTEIRKILLDQMF